VHSQPRVVAGDPAGQLETFRPSHAKQWNVLHPFHSICQQGRTGAFALDADTLPRDKALEINSAEGGNPMDAAAFNELETILAADTARTAAAVL